MVRCFAAALFAACGLAIAQSPAPRTIADITGLLAQYQPDAAKLAAPPARLRAKLPAGGTNFSRARFYYERAQSARTAGDLKYEIDSLRQAADLVRGTGGDEEAQYLEELFAALIDGGNFLDAARVRDSVFSMAGAGRMVTFGASVAAAYAALGDGESARAALARAESGYAAMQSIRSPVAQALAGFFAGVIFYGRGVVLGMEGDWAAAEVALRDSVRELGEDLERARVRALSGRIPPQHTPESHIEFVADWHDVAELRLADLLIELEQFGEAELGVRSVLRRSLARFGRYNLKTARALNAFSRLLVLQGRHQESGELAGAAVDIYEKTGLVPESALLARARREYAKALAAQERWSEAIAVFEAMRAGLALDRGNLKRFQPGAIDWAAALMGIGRLADAASMLRVLVAESERQLGADHSRTGLLRGVLGLVRAKAGERDAALREFGSAAHILVDGEDAVHSPAQARYVARVLDAYIDLLIETRSDPPGKRRGLEPMPEAFRLADWARGRSSQRTLARAALRAAANDPELADLALRGQTLTREMRRLDEALLSVLSAPSGQQSQRFTAFLRKRIDEASRERKAVGGEIAKRFPAYANLANPRPAALDDVRRALQPGEVFLSVFVTAERTFVWVVPKEGTVAVAATPLGEFALEGIVARLRRALDPGEVEPAALPAFDVPRAYLLYEQLLKPVESVWRGAHTLLVAVNGALEQLPFAVLPTGPTALQRDASLLFAEYRGVPWLAKSLAITQLPSANALVTQRAAPPAAGERSSFAGFADPTFGKEAALQVATQTRGAKLELRPARQARVNDRVLPIRKAAEWIDYSQLAPLPGTRDEIAAIAQTLKADPERDVFFGAEASKENLKRADLSRRRVVAFATHCLSAGDLPGLAQPALALAAPQDSRSSGLLSLEEIMGLKLDADWVVLPGCSTGDTAEAKTVSELARGFLYAGGRALLVTHWPVEARSARLLATGIFERYAADPALPRAEALRQSMLAILQTGEARDASDEVQFTYAHPIFWASYTLVEEGGPLASSPVRRDTLPLGAFP